MFLFRLLSAASLMFIPCAVNSSSTISIHFFGCLPLLFVPCTCSYSLFPSIFVKCPNHISLLFLILIINVISCPSSILATSFFILSPLDIPNILHSQLVSATSILLSSSFLRHQYSGPICVELNMVGPRQTALKKLHDDRADSRISNLSIPVFCKRSQKKLQLF